MSNRRFAPWQICALLGCLAAAVATCGIPTDSEPRDLAVDQLPENLKPTIAESTTTTTSAGEDIVTIWYQTDEGGIEGIRRVVERATLRVAVESLFEPEAADTPQGLSNQWVDDPPIRLIGTLEPDDQDGLVIDLTKLPPAAEGTLERATYAQLVWTATQSRFGVRRVRILVDGEPQRMLPDTRPADFVGRGDFPNFPAGAPPDSTTTEAPRPAAPATTAPPSRPPSSGAAPGSGSGDGGAGGG